MMYLRNVMMRFLFIFLIILSVSGATAQILPFQRYSTREGLNNRGASAIISDKRGLMWIGTAFGVNWFDGKRFYQPPMKARAGQLYVTRFYRDLRDDIWVMTFYNGLYRFHKNTFINYLPDSVNLESTANNVFDMVQVDRNEYLVATDRGAYLFDGRTFTLLDVSNADLKEQVSCVVKLGSRDFLLSNKGVYRYRKTSSGWERAGHMLTDIGVNRMAVDRGRIWLATERGARVYDTAALFGGDPEHIYLEDRSIGNILPSPQGDVWLASEGVYRLHDGKITYVNSANGFTDDRTHDAYYGDHGLLWFATDEGLFRFEERVVYSFDALDSISRSPFLGPMAVDAAKHLWFSVENTVARKTSSGCIAAHLVPSGKTISDVLAFHLDQRKRLWLGTEKGLVLLRNDKGILKSDLRFSSFCDDDSSILMGTTGGDLYRMLGEKIIRVPIPDQRGELVSALYRNGRNLWVGYWSKGIRVYDVAGDSLRLVQEFSSHNGYPNLRVRCFHDDGFGNLLVGTRTNGLYVFRPEDLFATPRHITAEEGLGGNWVKVMVNGNDGKLYIATNNGLHTVPVGQYEEPEIRQLHFGSDAIPTEFTGMAFDGSMLWAGTVSGLLRYFPEADYQDLRPPRIFLTQATINGRNDSSFSAYTYDTRRRSLAHDQNGVAFEFAGINLRGNGRMLYRYRLVGSDDRWNEPTERNFVSYRLSPGEYRFEVEARNETGLWSTLPAAYVFTIRKPFWQTTWFLGACLVSVATALYFIYRYRLQQALELEKLRSKISSDLHDDIGSTLSSISILSDLAARENSPETSSVMLAEIKTSSVQLMEKMDDIVWSINPKNDSLENLLLRIRQFASRLLEARNIEYDIRIGEGIGQLKLPMEHRQHIYLIMKEAINNLIKYSCCTQAWIQVSVNDGSLNIGIRDNGKGFDPETNSGRNGIISMKARALMMRGSLTMESSPGAGTGISLTVKIK